MRLEILSREYPPNVYGGAGVHVEELTRALRARSDLDVTVRAFDEPREEEGTYGYTPLEQLADANSALRTLGVDLTIAADVIAAEPDLVHSHTWYANYAGHLASLIGGMPHLVSAHSLEPMRPWKAEQLGGGYRLSCYVERTAYEHATAVIAVSEGMRRDVLKSYPDLDPDKVKVIHNGIDAELWQPDHSDAAKKVLADYDIDPDVPSVVFLGRITRQKGLPLLLKALRHIPEETQIVLLAGQPDTEEIGKEVEALVDELRGERSGATIWIGEMLPREKVVAVLSHAWVFMCPSVYEPLGIVNLEAMACGAAVVATETGGIPEVVVHGETGWLVPIEQKDDGTGTPVDEDQYVSDFAAALNDALSDRDRTLSMGEAGRRRAIDQFSWDTIAERTARLYASLLG
ncbi:MAG TPA: glycogen synthase [Ornithinimicrobium sp.]|uniref:glycogen synthase n=1 Tax=Ornithinimicrobium sp. TaxID=1977084 RepID=UPI002B461E59|nr:glycogen synthase [Ornithinimicrobium sp.]HKJ12941.1 glycogen synthase [Ornithinimicrobium sp.]